MSSTTAVFLLVCSVLSLALASGGSRLPHSATIIADDGVRVGGGPAAFEALVDENSTHNAVPADYGLPFSCQQQGCGPDVACGGGGNLVGTHKSTASSNCYLYQGMFLCCTVSPLGSR